MKRMLLPSHGPDLKNIQKAIAIGIVECEKLGLGEFTIVVASKTHFESSELGKLLGNAAKTLAKGEAVAVDSKGIKVKLESVATIQKLGTAKVVVAVHLTSDGIQKLDDLFIDVLIFLPWLADEGHAWAAKWAAEVFGDTKPVQEIDLPPTVVEALENLTSSVNLSSGLSHSSDKRDAKLCFTKLRDEGVVWNLVELEKWAVRNGWKAKDAQELATLSARYLRET